MKRRLLSAFLAVMMVLTMAPVAFAADTETTTEYVAQVDGNKYETLADAIEAANDGDTITLLKGGNGNGFKVPEGKFTEQGLTIDFNQFTYMIGGQLVGSAGTGTNGCQLLKNNKITFKNGSFVGATEGSKPADDTPDWHGAPAIMIQNYCDLTLENMIVTGGDETVYTFSNNCGNTVIKDSTINAGKAKGYGSGPFAFDVCRYSTYPSVSVTVQGSSVINGDVEISGTIGEGQSRQLNIEDGTFNGRFIVSNTPANISITGGKFSSDVSAYVAEGYVQNENGTVEQLGETNAVAKIDDTYYKTLADAVAAAKADEATTITLLKDVELPSYIYIKDKKNITLDLNGKNITRTGNGVFYVGNAKLRVTGTGTIFENQRDGFAPIIAKGSPDDVADYTTITIDENVTLKGDYAGIFVDTDTAGKNSYHNYGLVINMKGSIDLTAIDGGVSAYGVYVQGLNKITSGNVMQINLDGVTINTGDEAIYAAGYAKWNVKNCTFNAENAAIEVRAGDMTIDGGVYTAMASEFKCEANGNGSTTQGAALAIMQHTTKLPISVYVKNGVFHSAAAVAEKNIQKNDPKPNVDLQIADGQFNGVVVADDVLNFISGGYFTTDPTDYVASGYVAGTSDVSGYSYKVVAKTDTGNVEVKPAVAKPEVKVDKIPQADKEKVAAAAKTVSAPTLGAAAGDIVKDIDEAKATDLVNSATEVTGDKKLYVQSSLKVEPTAYDAANKTLALEITPQYRVVASTATTANEIKLDGDNKNAQVVQKYTDMTINTPTEVTMELPTGFAVADGDKLSIQHTKNGTVEYYTGTVTKKDDKFYLTFTTNGFSPFVISVPAASIGENVYPTLQAAVENVKKNETIKLAKDVDEAIVVTVAKSINFKVDTNSKKFDAAKNIVAGSNTTVKVTGESSPYTYEFSYTKPSSSGGSSSGKTTYKVTTSAVNNGGVNASPSNAEKGAVITITLSPDKGYKLDKLTVTDGSGKTVSTVKKSDTVYTFAMPASAVTVGVSYVKATETPSETKFNDVSANDWFASAVDYVTGKGMMNGTADNTFSPKANTTRGMVVTVLYRLENQPSTSAASFTDVASGAYYANAVAWANANGIVSGYGSGKFGPNDKVTREQLAAILYRYAQYKKYDVSGANSLDGYTDVQSVSSYAVPALQWANAAGVVTGKSGSKLDPKGNATRAEVAAMLMRFCENVK
nr:S-layer homology domain-containing protein [Butyricicoccus sp. OF30-11pH9A]